MKRQHHWLKNVFSAFSRSQVEESSLNASEKRELSLLRHACYKNKIGAWEMDVKSENLTFTSEAYRIYGLEESSPLQVKDLIARYDPANQAYLWSKYKELIRLGGSSVIESRVLTYDRDWIWVQLKTETEIRSGKVVRLFGTIYDITERVLASRTIAETQDLLERVINNTDALIYFKDLDLKYRLFNNEFVRVHGKSSDDLIGADDDLLFPSYAAESIRTMDKNILESGKTMRCELDLEVDGNKRVYASTRFPIYDWENKPLGVAGICFDITEQKSVQEALRTSNFDLEEFASIASHDLQEPLRVVRNFSKILKDDYGKGDVLDEKALSYLDFCFDAAKRMQDMVSSLLGYSRIANQKLGFGVVDLNKVLDEVRQNVSVMLQDTEAEIIIDGVLPSVKGDHNLLVRLFQNLISNGIKFRKSGRKPILKISAAEVDRDRIEFSVEDNGIGIPVEFFDTIFEVFQRLHSRSEHPGAGIGLSVCKKIVEAHGGKISVRSQEGSGSCFAFVLSAAKATDRLTG